MPVDLPGLYETVMNGLGTVPSAIIAAALLAGPTAIWLIARFLIPPDVGMTEEVVLEEILWVCPKCRSINEDRIVTCYRCHRLRAGESLPLVIETVQTRSAPGVGIAVGPGKPVLAPDNAWIEREVAHASNEVDDGGQPEEADLPPAEPASLTFEAVILEPRVKVSGRPGASQPAVRRARPKPLGTDETKPKRERKTGTG